MKISIYAMAVKTYVPMLRSLSHVLDQGAAHARAKKSDAAAPGERAAGARHVHAGATSAARLRSSR